MDARQQHRERIDRILARVIRVVGTVRLLWSDACYDGPLTGMCEWNACRYWFEFFPILHEGEDDDYEDKEHGRRYLLHSSPELLALAESRQRERLEHVGDGNVYRDVLGKWTRYGGVDRPYDEACSYWETLPDRDDDPIAMDNLAKFDDGIIGWFFERQTSGGTGAIDVWTKEQCAMLDSMGRVIT